MVSIDKTDRWRIGGMTFLLWALVMASVTFWALRLSVPGPSAGTPPSAAYSGEQAIDSAAVARLLGAVITSRESAAPAAAVSRFVLLGVVADQSNRGAALISVDGKPAKPFRVGGQVAEGMALKAVEPRLARLGPTQGEGTETVLDMPSRKTPQGH